MRFFSTPLVALAVALAVTGCGGAKAASSDSSDQAAKTSSASSSTASTSAGKAVNEIPEYPGAVTQAAGSGSNMGTDAAGKVMSTADSFDKVYGWYQQKMPSGSERSHIDAPVQSAVFMIGEASSGQSSVTLTTQGGKTMITIAHVKM
ncbi:MAG TPA: hypothetical protein VKR05_05770 [Candidatus Cybelea sp.]|nr:hypothetical protein [Candidatus Cybelea sp.]